MSLFSSLIPNPSKALPSRRSAGASEPGSVVRPAYEIVENDEAYGLTVYLPGVPKDGLEITAEADHLRITGRRAWKQPQGWTALYRESPDVPYELVLEHENAIDLEKIHAELKDGILLASLPKAEALKPRKISVS